VEVREFAADSFEGAVEKAAKHFGVPTDQLDVSVLSGRVSISGIGGRVLVLATVRAAPVETGPTGAFVREVLERMGFGDGLRIDEIQEEGEVIVRVRGDQLQRLMRRDKRVHGALAHLANRVAQKLLQADVMTRLDFDADSAGEERLEEMARSRAREAREEGREVLLPPMDSRERWVVHNALKTVDGISSESVGTGRLKRVKIFPA
jgi:spoIIIJ-associated protein